LTAIARQGYSESGQTFETGVRQAMIAVLASPRFIFRSEEPAPNTDDQEFPLIDEFSLATRLSYFLWSTAPDDELLRLAERGELRLQLAAQVRRMLQHERSAALVENFAGQWLRARDIEHVAIEPLSALDLQDDLERLEREQRQLRGRGRGGRGARGPRRGSAEQEPARGGAGEDDRLAQQERERQERLTAVQAELAQLARIRESFTTGLRRAMRRETEMTVEYVIRNDRSVLELIDGNYTFLDEELARHYGVDGVTGGEMQRIELPDDSPRGGVLTQGTILAVTSNPTRTSPVKRGLFILDNILGTPAPPPPAPVPPLEQSAEAIRDHEPTLREAMELHRREPLCAACHARMDPLGLALENFNALGMWRQTQHERSIDASGQLLTGEKFDNFAQLKRIIAGPRRLDFYRCLAEKMLIYALGRGLEYYDEHTIDQVAERLEANEGEFSSLLMGIVESASFQRQRRIVSSE
jgi:hypothetical protein